MGLFLDDTSQKLRSGWVIVLFFGVATAAYLAGNAVVEFLGFYPTEPLGLDDPNLLFPTMVMLVATVVPTLFCSRALHLEVGLPGGSALRHTLIGSGLGAGLVTLSVGVAFIAGQAPLTLYRGSVGALVLSGALQWVVLVPTSVGEELLFRGVALRQLAGATREWIAILLTSGSFGLIHLMNPNATWVGGLNVALVGIWFGILALRSSLWTSIAAHTSWNWFEGFVFGQPVSGIKPGTSLFVGSVQPSGFFSGAHFGPEASGLTTVLLIVAIVASQRLTKKS